VAGAALFLAEELRPGVAALAKHAALAKPAIEEFESRRQGGTL
jgi:hypothetical protein